MQLTTSIFCYDSLINNKQIKHYFFGTRLILVLTLARTKLSYTQVCPIGKATLKPWAMNVTSTGNISIPHVLDQ